MPFLLKKVIRYKIAIGVSNFHFFKNIPVEFRLLGTILKKVQSWVVKSSPRAILIQNGPLLSLKADDDPQMFLQFPTITSFIGTVESRHHQSKTDDGRVGSVRHQWNFSLARELLKKILAYD